MATTGVRKTRWAWTAGTFFGVGRMRPGPGTWAAACAGALWWIAGESTHAPWTRLAGASLCAAAAAVAVGVAAGTRIEKESARRDPGFVVIDEVAGQWVALIGSHVSWMDLLAAFVFFRLFDILKPWPARQLEQLPGGWGIMFDDVAAGVYALLAVQALQYWIGR